MRLPSAYMDIIVKTLNNNNMNFSNPDERQRAYKAMRNLSEQTVKVMKAKSVHEMLRSMRSKNVTLGPVKAMCKKLYSGKAENHRRSVMENMVMKWKEDDARITREKVRRQLSHEWREGENVKVLDKFKITNSFKRLTNKENENELTKMRMIKKKKVDFLIAKEKEARQKEREEKHMSVRCAKVHDLCKSVSTADREIPESFNREPRVYGGASISEEEKTTLRLPPKYTIYEKVNKQRCNVEIESMVSKYLWQLRKDEDENENEEEASEISCSNEERSISVNEVSNRSNTNESDRLVTDTASAEVKNDTPQTQSQSRVPDAQQNVSMSEPVANRTRSQSRRQSAINHNQMLSASDNPQTSLLTTPPTPGPITPSPSPTPTTTVKSHDSTSTTCQNRTKNQNNSNPKTRKEVREYHYDIDQNTFDFRNLRPTDLPSNKHVFLPQNERNKAYNEEEINLAHLSLELQKATDEIIMSHKVEPNLSRTEMKGLKKLKRREDIVIFQTDKSSRFSVDTKTNYINANKKHTEQDEVINEQQYSLMQKEVNAHATMWTEFLKAGENAGENGKGRVKANMISSDKTDPPPLYGLRKDHKKCEDPEGAGPPTRPVCGATAAHNGKLSHLISIILKEVKREDSFACESTEDILAEIDTLNKEHATSPGNKLMVGSLDVKALYPSLDIPFASKMIAQEYLKSDVDIHESSIDVDTLGLYLILTVDEEELKEEKIRDYCPTRAKTLGRKPNITGQATASAATRANTWRQPLCSNPDKETRKRMFAKALEVGINAVMNTHVYKFAGETRAQTKGGAIGLELTGEIAGVFLTWWDRCMRERIEKDGMKLIMYKRYVDDINLVVEVKEEEEEKEVWQSIRDEGNKIHESIQLEEDYPSNYPDKKVPILDIKVWVNEEGKVVHEYYRKQVSSKAVIDSRSAMPVKDKRTVLSQDLLRVLLRCSPELTWEEKKKHIDEYVLRMQYSGYSEEFRKDIVRSAISAYEKIKGKVERGERPLYRSKKWKQKERRKEKRNKKDDWYNKGDKNGYKSVIFVQPTRNSVLKKKFEEVIEKSKCKVKVVEKAGSSIRQKLQKSYPFKKDKCDDECFVCLSEGDGNCRKENVNYEVECTREGCRYVYYGETSRTGYSRGLEHLRGIKKKDKDSVFVEHVIERHSSDFEYDKCSGFKMNICETHKSAFERLVTEAVKIDLSERPTMNRKTGFKTNTVLRLSSSLSAEHSC